MKQFVFLFILALVGYFVLWGGTTNVLHRADINPKKLISDIASGVNENLLPEIDPTRNGFKFANPNSYRIVKDNILITYDPDICLGLVDMVYSSGSPDSESLVKQYLKMFTSSEDNAKILNLLSAYKDKQTLRILIFLYKDSDVSKPALLKMLVEYHTPEVAQIIKEATTSEDLVLSHTAQMLVDTIGDKKWYLEGVKNLGEGYGIAQNYKGTDFENEMQQF